MRLLRIFALITLTGSGFAGKTLFSQDKQDSILYMDIPALVVTPLPPQPEHPYLLFSKKDLPEIRKKASDPAFENIWRIIKDDALHPANNKFNLVNQVLPGCIAWQITGDTLYAKSVMALLDTLMNSNYRWSKPDESAPDLKYMNWTVGDKALSIAYAYDMLFDILSEEQKDTYLEALKIKIFSYYSDAHAYHDTVNHKFFDQTGHYDWWTTAYFLWNSKINGSMGMAALATLWDLPESPLVLRQARASLRYTHPEFNQGDIESGGFDEGTIALGSHLSYLTDFYQALIRVFGTDDGFFELPGVPMSLDFYMNYTGPDKKTIPFGFDPHRAFIDPPSQLHYLADRYHVNELHSFLDVYSFPAHQRPFALLWRPIHVDTIMPGPRPAVKVYKDIGWGYLNDQRYFIPFKAGDNASNHTQLDAGNLIIYYGSQMLITSPPFPFDSTKYQNCVLVNNEGQTKGDPHARVLGQHSDVRGVIYEYHEFNKNLHAGLDLTPCYAGLKNYQRHILLNDMGTFIVVDAMESYRPERFSVNWQSNHLFSGIKDSVQRVASQKRELTIFFESNLKTSCQIDTTEYGQTLSYQSTPDEKGYFITMFSPFGTKNSDMKCTFSDEMVSVEITVKNKTKTYYFFINEGRVDYIPDYR